MAKKITLLYDTDCPFCSNYCKYLRIKETAGTLELISAREDTPLRAEVTKRGWSLDNSMVLQVGEELYHGPEVIHMLAVMSTKSGFFNKLNYYIFSSKAASKTLYPILTYLRRILLFIIRIPKINNVKNNNEQ